MSAPVIKRMAMDALPPGSSIGRLALMRAAAQALIMNTRRGSNRSAMPSTADVERTGHETDLHTA
jgi:hypothetical protein